VAQIATHLDPRALLDALLAIERRHGRVRSVPNGPRTLDLDILLYGNRVIREPGLTIPHPRMHERAFVIVPLAEIAPDERIPSVGTVAQCVEGMDTESVARIADLRA
jgi:2-amino-4-hydroxy-6-hydroxymethyldihydropteridine diphosphokinase